MSPIALLKVRSIARSPRRGTVTKCLGAVAALLWMVLPNIGHASCAISPQGATVVVPLSFTTTTVTIDPNAPVNTVLATLAGSTAGMTSQIRCTEPTSSLNYIGVGAAITTVNAASLGLPYGGTAALYPTTIPGIGYVTYWDGWGVWAPSQRSGTGWGNNQGATAHVYLIKTGPIPGGTNMLSGTFATWTMQPANTVWMQFDFGTPIVVIPKNPTCTVATPSVSVTLPDQSADGFSGVGTTAGAAQNFNIGVTCTGGDVGTSTKVYVTLTDATNPGNTTDMLSPTASTSNTGVGVRIFNGATPVKFGPDSNTVGNTNQWLVTTVNPGSNTVSIPLSAQYVQVGSTVRGGPVQAIATFTMAYN